MCGGMLPSGTGKETLFKAEALIWKVTDITPFFEEKREKKNAMHYYFFQKF